MTPEERVRDILKRTGGTMPLRILVADEDEKARAEAAKAGHRWAKKVAIITAAEYQAERARSRRPAP